MQNLSYVKFGNQVSGTALPNSTSAHVQCLVLAGGATKVTIPKCAIDVIVFNGNEEEWDALNLAATTKANLEKCGTKIIFNSDGTGAEVPATIVQQPQSKRVIQGIGDASLTIEVAPSEDAIVQYRWYKSVDGKISRLLSGSNTLSVDTGVVGVADYFCVVRNIVGGVISETTTDSATVEVVAYSPDEAFQGSGTEDDPWLIANQSDLVALANFVNGGDSLEGKYVKLSADIELPADWEPMGCTIDGSQDIKKGENLHAFSGVLDGDGHTVVVPENGLPLIGYVKGATVKNLNVYGQRINGYGLVNNLYGVGLAGSAVTIDNVTIKSGSNIVKSGLLGTEVNVAVNVYAGTSSGFAATIRNCTVEPGVTVGCDGDQSMVGSIAGRFQGTIENCKSFATVKGVNYVGGIVGSIDQAMGVCSVADSQFAGTVIASGNNAGGIAGGGYENSTAPNGNRVDIIGNTVSASVSGIENVGGILGGDEYVAQSWGPSRVRGNVFDGSVSGTKNVGGVIGFYDSLNSYNEVANNTFVYTCGADKGIGAVRYVDTNCDKPALAEGTTYFNTGDGTDECPEVEGCVWRTGLNRDDDPLGADADKLCKMISPEFAVAMSAIANEPVKVGDTFTVDVALTANYGVACMEATLDYDPAELELVSVVKGAGLSEGASFLPTEGKGEAHFSFQANEADAKGGIVVATATFRALKASEAATVNVKDATAGLSVDPKEYGVTVGEPASVAVIAAALLGDANNSGKVNIVDAQIVYDMSTNKYGEGYVNYPLPAGWTMGTLLWVCDVNAENLPGIDAVDAFAIQRFVHYGSWS